MENVVHHQLLASVDPAQHEAVTLAVSPAVAIQVHKTDAHHRAFLAEAACAEGSSNGTTSLRFQGPTAYRLPHSRSYFGNPL